MTCLACGHSEFEGSYSVRDLWFQYPGSFTYRECTDCHSLQQVPLPTNESLDESYASYYTHATTPKNSLLGRLSERNRRASLLRLFPSATSGTILDFGCGAGEDLLLLRNAGWNVVGVEPDPAAREVASRTHAAVYPHIEHLPPDQDIQFVLMRHVIEHVVDPAELLTSIRCRFPGVEVVVITPNAGSLGRKLFRSYWRGFDAPRHVTVYSSGGLDRVAAASGYVDVAVHGGATSLGGIETASLLAWFEATPRTALYLALRVLGIAIGLVSLLMSKILRPTYQEELFAKFR